MQQKPKKDEGSGAGHLASSHEEDASTLRAAVGFDDKGLGLRSSGPA